MDSLNNNTEGYVVDGLYGGLSKPATSQSDSSEKDTMLSLLGGVGAVARITSRAAIASDKWRGRGNNVEADRAAVEAMRYELNRLPICGEVVIGEGERDKAPMLYIGEKVGNSLQDGPRIDIALDPLEGTTLTAHDMPGALCVVAFARQHGLLNAPDVYMKKIAVGSGIPPGTVSIDDDVADNVAAVAAAKGVTPNEVTVCVLARERHRDIIASIHATGARVHQITDGDIAAVIQACRSDNSGIDMYLGTGGAPEGVLAAAAVRCLGGYIEGRLVLDSEEKITRTKRMLHRQGSQHGESFADPFRVFKLEDLAASDAVFVATGVTDGSILGGVKRSRGRVITETMVLDSAAGEIYYLRHDA